MEERENTMGSRPVFPLLMSMSVPPMISMLIQSLYNIVDSIFVARISDKALTAVSLAYPLQNLIIAVAVGYGVGINACIARSLGAKRQEETNQTAAHGALGTALHCILFILVGVFLTEPFLRLFTDDPEIFSMGCSYTYIVVCFSFGSLFHIYIEKMFQATGNMVMPMILQGVGALINIILDPIMIFGLFGFPAMGVTGAAAATVAGQILACILAVTLFNLKEKNIRVSFRAFHFDRRIFFRIYSIGIPSCIMLSLPALLVGILNSLLVGLSSVAVAVFGLYFKLQSFVYMPENGIIQGMRPIISYNYGAGHLDRMRETVRCSMISCGAILAAGTLLFLAVPDYIMMMFGAEGEMMEMGMSCLRIISLGFIFSAAGTVFSGCFEAIGRGLHSLAVSLVRQLVVIPPLAFLLAETMGVTGVWIAFPAAEILAALLGLVLYRGQMRKVKLELLGSLEKEERR